MRDNDRRAAFTLIEIMLVVVIIGISAAAALPVFVRSFRGAQLRTSMRTLVMLHKYARSTAVLKQEHHALLFDTATHKITLITAQERGSELRGGFIDQEIPDAAPPENMEEDGGEDAVDIAKRTERYLEDGVRIERFVSGRSDQEVDGIYWINYFPNGMCDEYTVMVEDSRDKRAEMEVDSISGKVEVRYE